MLHELEIDPLGTVIMAGGDTCALVDLLTSVRPIFRMEELLCGSSSLLFKHCFRIT